MFTSIGIIGGIILNAGCLPQIIKLFKTRSAKDFSLFSYITYLFGIILLTIYSFYINDLLFIILNLTALAGIGIIIIGIFLYSKNKGGERI